MATAFQSDTFQNDTFQIDGAPASGPGPFKIKSITGAGMQAIGGMIVRVVIFAIAFGGALA